ncbi:MAG: cobyric acid synthase [Firmicutes bacterium]|nr:cobyric acid synthase [Bacillota bacterium]
MGLAKTVMVQGVASDVGKSVLVAALCRILAQDGYRVAPFKAQNMALNSFVTAGGGEIGRAQAVQAEAARVDPTVDMNPILLKPVEDTVAQVIVHGRAIGNMTAQEYMRFKKHVGWKAITESLRRLREEYNIVVIEGAGSPAEVNLRDNDIVNMPVAVEAGAPVILVGDIDRGGVFAYLVGTLELLEPWERGRIKGIIINKFRGQKELLKPGLDMLTGLVGIPVLGVVPYFMDFRVPEEDSLCARSEGVTWSKGVKGEGIEIAVIYLPHISNFTDFDLLETEPETEVHYIRRGESLGRPDAVIIPGTKNTIDDLAYLRETGRAGEIVALSKAGVPVVGICGGYQMLGRELRDPLGLESRRDSIEGLDLLDVVTELQPDKMTHQAEALIEVDHGPFAGLAGRKVKGYEIHMGISRPGPKARPLLRIVSRSGRDVSVSDGAIRGDGLVFGTYLHGIFDNDSFRRRFINWLRERKGLQPLLGPIDSSESEHERAYERLALTVRESIEMELFYRILDSHTGRC